MNGRKQEEKLHSCLTHRLSRLLVHVSMGKSCIMLAPRSILKHADSEEESSLLTAEQRHTLGGGAKRRAGVVAARLTGNAAPTGSGTLKHPRRTGGCRTDVWEDRERVGGGVIHESNPV